MLEFETIVAQDQGSLMFDDHTPWYLIQFVYSYL
jgi:hypothetical protein